MPISFKYFLQSIYLSENPEDEENNFGEWIEELTYQELCDYGEEYLEKSHARIQHLFNLN